MNDDLQISQSLPILSAFLMVFCIGSWLLIWRDIWPPSSLQIGAAGIGTLIGVIYCLARIWNWDVRAWEWRDEQHRNRIYPLILYRILPFSGVVGVLAAMFIDRTFGKAVGLAFVPLMGTGVGLIFFWHTVEAVQHIHYHRTRK